MAQFRLAVQSLQRAEGRSAVAAAAYRSGTRLIDERLMMEFDFASKDGVEFEMILAPDEAPAAFRDRQMLWNEAEAAEGRKDAVPAREILLSLPHELNLEQRRQLVEAFVTEHLTSRGMIADVALHRPGKEGDHRNFHAHILVTTRTVGPGGFGAKSPEWRGPAMIRQWRAGWADIQNDHLRRHLGPDAPQVSHLSLTARGEDREPSVHLGPEATAMERRSETSARGDLNRDVAAANHMRKEARSDYQEMAERLANAAPEISVPVSRLLEEATTVRERMMAERDAMIAQRTSLPVTKVQSVRSIEREITDPARRALTQAKHRLARVNSRAAWVRARRHSLSSWLRNPARMIWAKHAELNAIARARAAVRRAEVELAVRSDWVRSPAGRSYIAGRRDPQLKAASEIATQRRTLERKIRRAEKRIISASRAVDELRITAKLGTKELRVPTKVPDEVRFIRSVSEPAQQALMSYSAAARELAVAELNQRPTQDLKRAPGRSFSPDL